mgnify:CR=1 FL=1
MIVYVSPAEMNGGILQFSTTIAKETEGIENYKLFLPDTVDYKYIQDIKENVILYKKVKTLNSRDNGIKEISNQIMKLNPEVVIFVEDSILMQQINRILHKARIDTAMVIHDIQHHPYRNMDLHRIVVDTLRRKMSRTTIKQCKKIILLSHNSETAFKNEYNANNTTVFRLSAHVPNVEEKELPELKEYGKKFHLFFGRIDEYKGIQTLAEAYAALRVSDKENIELIIAGKGELSDSEKTIIDSEPHIHLIQRFISDEEMIWLFKRCVSIVLPYTEASQSGVLPIAYKYGKPVIVSNLKGLTENVVPQKTGLIFKDVNDLSKCLNTITTFMNRDTKEDISNYYEQNYSWKTNIEKLIHELV